MDKRMLSLIFLAHSSDVLENAFGPLRNQFNSYKLSFHCFKKVWSFMVKGLLEAPNEALFLCLFKQPIFRV